jgi:hypothetical protein
MKIFLVTASVNELNNLNKFKDSLGHEAEIVVVDEGDETIRKKNLRLLSDLNCRFYGPKEREVWFKERFRTYERYLSVIPKRCHAETSFGFLVAWEEGADIVIELDDDVLPVNGYNLIRDHISNLFNNSATIVLSRHKWYNVLENLIVEGSAEPIFPRGHPYSPQARLMDYTFTVGDEECILNMGLWLGHPDLDALTILYHRGLNGRCHLKGIGLRRRKVIVGKGTYFAICSMNTAFKSNIIPAFYQLYMNYLGIDRFDDIWSGVFIKKIADHLGDKVSIGAPLVYHDKRSRNTFKDLRAELEGIVINEVLWKIVDSVKLEQNDYFSCYEELADGIERNLIQFNDKSHRDFIRMQVQKMRTWLEIVDKLK